MAGFTNEDNIKTGKKKEVKRVIKTYRDIAVDTLGSNPTSLAKMIIEEKKKKEIRSQASIDNPKNKLFFALSILLALLGVMATAGVVVLINSKNNIDKTQSALKNIQTIVSYDYREIVDMPRDEDSLREEVISIVDGTVIPDLNLKNIIFTERDELGYKQQVSSKTFIKTLNTRAPQEFLVDLKDKFNLGAINVGGNHNETFAVFEVYNTDSSVVNMWAWEKSMLYDIGDIFQVKTRYYGRSFRDIRLFNQDVKAVLDDEGKIVLAYSFIRPKIIAIFTSSVSLKVILTKLEVLERN